MLRNNAIFVYTLAMPQPSSHLFDVGIEISGLSPKDESLELIMPVWRAGRYFIFDFASGVQEFEAKDNKGNELDWSKTDKCTWRINTGDAISLKVTYKVFANEFNQRTRGLNHEHAFVNGTAVFMYSEKYRSAPVTLKIVPYKDWQIITGLESETGDLFTLTAPNYDYFVDCPIEIGRQKVFEFDIDGRKHIFSLTGGADIDRESLVRDITKIIRKNYELWGSVPYNKYVFIVHCSPQSGGGTEHINSTVLGVKRSAFETESGYSSFLRLVSHEFFHTWNVKQLKPKGLTPYDYTKENYTSELWIAEGGTSYYDGLNVLRTGQYSLDEFYKEIVAAIDDDKRRPGNRVQSVADSSFDAWIKFWKPTQNKFASESDYYGRGSYICLILDLEIRNSSANRHSLDDIFRKMFNDFPLDIKGYTNDDFKSYAEDAAGVKLDKFFNDYVYGRQLIDWEKYLSYAGLELHPDNITVIPALGLKTSFKEGKIIVDEVIAGSPAKMAGITVNDEIAALGRERLSYAVMENKIKELAEGDNVTLTIVRNDKLSDVILTLRSTTIPDYKLEKKANPTALQKEIYESWLGVKW